ncbi:MAG: tRNA 2-selenouridine(34) synthase MnmH [Pseudomonadota bacterium]
MKDYMLANVAQLSEFDALIDVRSPSEFAEDHLPGAINLPVLDDEQRARVGTLYSQVSPFEAKKLGAALIARNIADHLEQHLLDRPKSWRPLVYCWRGGKRSGSLTHILREIGWDACRLDGGYKTFRRTVIADLHAKPSAFQWRVLCGPTGSGKSRLLRALEAAGEQVLDLEALAAHRGSLLGHLPGQGQPAQKWFETLVWSKLRQFSAARPVYVEAESRKVGALHVPESVLNAMYVAPCLRLETPLPVRVALLKEEYAHFLAQPDLLKQALRPLVVRYGRERVAEWDAKADAGDWDGLVEALLVQHYDPAYTRSMQQHYPQLDVGATLQPEGAGEPAFSRLAAGLSAAVSL